MRQILAVYLNIQTGGKILGIKPVCSDDLHDSGCGQVMVQQIEILKYVFREERVDYVR